ncbi:hypothetical protein BV898_05936 [Hypsibius exemplaris]|uniref:DUF7789 domain-containing protein n=1 Tax=Hypsibius exemplaris TaxID=2072580 RepID=A0A1W0WY59_HYPEX|nr:hypothetical protein BV898_05936 [Hypsibius exemplaris]
MDFLSADGKPKEKMTSSIFGRRRTLNDLNKSEVLFLSVGLVSLVACSGLTIERLVYLSPANCPHLLPGQNHTIAQDQKCGAEFTFALLIFINCGFCLFHVFHGVIWERPYELYIFIASVGVATCYCIVDFIVGIQEGLYQNTYPFTIKLTRLVILLTVGVLDVVLACRIAWDFLRAGRFACNVVQTYDEVLQKKCKIHFFTQSLLTFDLEFQVTLVVLILRNGFEFNVTQEELGLLIGGLVFTVIWIVAANFSIRYENRPVTWAVLATSVLEPAYIIYKMVDSANILKSKNADAISTSLHYCVFIGGSLGLLIRLVTVGALYTTKQSYGEGLNERIYGDGQFSFSTLKPGQSGTEDTSIQ